VLYHCAITSDLCLWYDYTLTGECKSYWERICRLFGLNGSGPATPAGTRKRGKGEKGGKVKKVMPQTAQSELYLVEMGIVLMFEQGILTGGEGSLQKTSLQ
jgi:hypothetical protein